MHSAWGKFEDGQFHALEAHCMDVSAVFAELCLLPGFRDRLDHVAGQQLTQAQLLTLQASVFLHDLGKLHPDFQAKSKRTGGPSCNHCEAGLGLLIVAEGDRKHPLHDLVVRVASCVSSDLFFAIAAHHGKPVSIRFQRPESWKGLNPEATRQFASLFRSVFAEVSAPLPALPAFVHLVAGMTALADWIGSDRDFFPFEGTPDERYPDTARHRAKRAVETIGLRLGSVRDASFESLTGFETPRAAQALIGDLDPSTPLAILEAETGSGKTEAALWHFLRQYHAGYVSGLYFAVPTRAAAGQLFERVQTALERIFLHPPEAILAIPGQRVSGHAMGYALPGFRTLWDDSSGPVKARWASEHATRFLAAPVAVGTIDQAMLSALQVKHAHMRGACLARSLLVLDEVHASDEYMTEVSSGLLEGHLSTGGKAMLMSATLGAAARSRYLKQSVPDPEDAMAAPYPVVWEAKTPHVALNQSGSNKLVQLNPLKTFDCGRIAEVAIEAAQAGASVLIIRNTVRSAQELFTAVNSAGAGPSLMNAADGPALHHSGFAAVDRKLLDAAAEKALCPRRNVGQGCIVIGTQTLEQSLDIDADILLTDLCPVDVLLQRIGRLHRHRRERPPGFEAPQIQVFLPENGMRHDNELARNHGLGGWLRDGALEGIYFDLPVLALTQELIENHPIWQLPKMNRMLVESATHPEMRQRMAERRGWLDYDARVMGKAASDAYAARRNLLRRDHPFPEAFPDDERIVTRLGGASVLIDLPPGIIGPFGQELDRLRLGASLAHRFDPEAPVVSKVEGAGVSFTIGDLELWYDRAGLRLA